MRAVKPVPQGSTSVAVPRALEAGQPVRDAGAKADTDLSGQQQLSLGQILRDLTARYDNLFECSLKPFSYGTRSHLVAKFFSG